jgi:hypothetical protein
MVPSDLLWVSGGPLPAQGSIGSIARQQMEMTARSGERRWLLGAQVEVAGGERQPLLVLAARPHV